MSTAPAAAGIRIREFGAGDDIGTVLALIAESFGEMALDPPSGAMSETRETIMARGASEPVLLAETEDAIVGCLFCKEREAVLYVGRLSVMRAHRRRGIGAALLDAAADLARRAELPAVELRVRIALPGNVRFFEARGFGIVGQGAHPGHAAPTYLDMRRPVE